MLKPEDLFFTHLMFASTSRESEAVLTCKLEMALAILLPTQIDAEIQAIGKVA